MLRVGWQGRIVEREGSDRKRACSAPESKTDPSDLDLSKGSSSFKRKGVGLDSGVADESTEGVVERGREAGARTWGKERSGVCRMKENAGESDGARASGGEDKEGSLESSSLVLRPFSLGLGLGLLGL